MTSTVVDILHSAQTPCLTYRAVVPGVRQVPTRQLSTRIASRRYTCSHASIESPALSSMRGVSVVLVNPKNPQNIGSCLRLAGNMGIGSLILVAPRCDRFDPVISTVACRSPLLEESRMIVHDSLESALAQSTLSLCFTRRKGGGRKVVDSLHTFLEDRGDIVRACCSDRGKLMLVFGREESGLSEDEVSMCSHAIEIPSDPSFPSLNLSHAVAVVTSGLFQYFDTHHGKQYQENDALSVATHEELEALLHRLSACLTSMGIDPSESRGGGDKSNHGRKRLAPGHIRNILLRSQATQQEVRSLFGLVKELEKRASVQDSL
jgi:TrmH family RNA methyltransferase